MLRQGRFARVGAAGLLALFSGSTVHAQSSVTLYGIVDAGLLYTSKTVNSVTGQNAGKQLTMISGNAPTLFGLSGAEDLGNGLKLTFKLESGVSIANGGITDSNGNFFGRQAWVALDGRYGTFKAGLQFSPFVIALIDTDPRAFSVFGSTLVSLVDNVSKTGSFTANAVSYTSPTIGGLQGSVLYALGGQAGDFQAGRQYSARLKYDLGGFTGDLAIFNGNGGGTAPVGTTVPFMGRMIGAGYKYGPFSAKFSFVNYKVAGSFNANVYGGGFDYLAMPTLDLNAGVWVTSDRNNTTNHSVMGALGANYYLSKRTTLYAQFGAVNNHGAMKSGLSLNGALSGAPGTTIGAALGIRHNF